MSIFSAIWQCQHTGSSELSFAVEQNTVRYLQLFADVIDELKPRDEVLNEDDVFDVITMYRMKRREARQSTQTGEGEPDRDNDLPKELTRRLVL